MARRVTITAILGLCAAGVAHADDRAVGSPPARTRSSYWTEHRVGTALVVSGAIIDVSALILGGYALRMRDDARDAGCTSDLARCPAPARSTAELAYSAANRATLMFGIGSALVGVGLYLRITAPHAQAMSIAPAIAPDSAGAALSWSF